MRNNTLIDLVTTYSMTFQATRAYSYRRFMNFKHYRLTSLVFTNSTVSPPAPDAV